MRVFCRHILILFFGFLLSYPLSAQCDGDPPPTDACEDAPIFCSYEELDDYCFLMTDLNSGNRPAKPCPPFGGGGIYTNWLAFYAECTDLQLIITASNCVPEMDLYVGVFNYNGLCIESHEDPTEILYCTTGCKNVVEWGSQQFDIDLFGLGIGDVYYILISGCQPTNCEITIEVLTLPAEVVK